MNFYEARAISSTGLHIRREAWEDKWFILWRGLWWCSDEGLLRPVLATDYTAEDLAADDWTTMPAPLVGCVIGTPPGSTGGGSAAPGSGGFPAYHGPGSVGASSGPPTTPPPGPPFPPGSPSTSLPPPTGTGLSVQIAGVTEGSNDPDNLINGVSVNDTYALPAIGPNAWGLPAFRSGTYLFFGDTVDILWSVGVTRDEDRKFSVHLENNLFFGGGFFTTVGTEKLRGVAIPNGSEGIFHDGTATVK